MSHFPKVRSLCRRATPDARARLEGRATKKTTLREGHGAPRCPETPRRRAAPPPRRLKAASARPARARACGATGKALSSRALLSAHRSPSLCSLLCPNCLQVIEFELSEEAFEVDTGDSKRLQGSARRRPQLRCPAAKASSKSSGHLRSHWAPIRVTRVTRARP